MCNNDVPSSSQSLSTTSSAEHYSSEKQVNINFHYYSRVQKNNRNENGGEYEREIYTFKTILMS